MISEFRLKFGDGFVTSEYRLSRTAAALQQKRKLKELGKIF